MKKRKMPKGKPFQPGPDPRRNVNGRRCKDALEFDKEFSRLLAGGGDPQKLARVLWKKAMRGSEWAIDAVLDRLCGKPLQRQIIQQPHQNFVITYANTAEEWAKAHNLDPEKVRALIGDENMPAESILPGPSAIVKEQIAAAAAERQELKKSPAAIADPGELRDLEEIGE